MQTERLVARPMCKLLIGCDDRALALRVPGVQDLTETLTAFAYAPYVVEDEQILASKVLHLSPVGGRSCVACIV